MNKVMGQVIIEIFVTHWLCIRGQNQRVWVFNSVVVVVAQDKTKKTSFFTYTDKSALIS